MNLIFDDRIMKYRQKKYTVYRQMSVTMYVVPFFFGFRIFDSGLYPIVSFKQCEM